jgi:hypothetical protein
MKAILSENKTKTKHLFGIVTLVEISVCWLLFSDRLCAIEGAVPGYRSGGPCSIPGAARFSTLSLSSTIGERLRSIKPRLRP